MKPYYAIRNHEVIEVVPLRGKLYCAIDKMGSIRSENGKLYADDELLIGEKNIFLSKEEAEASLSHRAKEQLAKEQRDDERLQAYLADRDKLINELLSLAESRGLEFSGVSFATNEQIEEAIWKLKNLSDKELELINE